MILYRSFNQAELDLIIKIIDGTNFSNRKRFYQEIEDEFTSGLNWKIGRNLNVFNDVLGGGFGTYDCGESIIMEKYKKKQE